MKNKLKAIRGTAIYTGGGVYVVIGQLSNGLFFNGCNDWVALTDKDVREVDEEGELCCENNEWWEGHYKTDGYDFKDVVSMFKDFCERLDKGEKNLTEGFDKFSNYLNGEVTRLMHFDEWNYQDEKEEEVKEEIMTNNNSYLVKIEPKQLHYCLNLMFADFVRSRELDEKTTQAYIEYYYNLIDGDYYDCEWFVEPRVIDIKKTVLDDMFEHIIVFHNKQEMFDSYPEYNNDFDKIGDDHHLFVASNGYIVFSK